MTPKAIMQLAILGLAVAGPTLAQPVSHHGGPIPRRTAVMSDQVAIERLRISGVRLMTPLAVDPSGNLTARGDYRGRPVAIFIDGKSGEIREGIKGSVIVPGVRMITPRADTGFAWRDQIAKQPVPVQPLPFDRMSIAATVRTDAVTDQDRPR